MSTLTQLSEMLGNVVTQKVDSQLFDWIRAVSFGLDNLEGGTQAQLRFVNKAGDDTIGDGSFDAPFLTIQRAITSITDAAIGKQYAIIVAPGTYTEAFVLIPWVFVQGMNQKAVVVNNPSANWVGAAFAAGINITGLQNLTLNAAVVVDFAAAGAAASCTIVLEQISLGAALTLRGNLTGTCKYIIQDLFVDTLVVPVVILDSFGSGFINGTCFLLSNVTISQADGFFGVHRIGSFSTGGIFTVAWTGANTANSLFVLIETMGEANPKTGIVITGAGAQLQATLSLKQVTLPDANTTLSFGNIPNGGTQIGVASGYNLFRILPTANRTLTLEQGGVSGTRVRIKNDSAFFVTIAVSAGATIVNGPTYIGPGGVWDAFSDGNNWIVTPQTQGFSVALVNGVSPFVPADISASSVITCTLKTFSGAAGIPAALSAGRVIGTRAGGGGFVVTSYLLATGAVVATDQGTYDCHVVDT